MALTTYGVNDALAVKAWARTLDHEVRKGLAIAPLIGTSKSSIIQEKRELKGVGDQVTYGLRTRLKGTGKTENEGLEGNEESLTTFSDSLVINELDHAVRSKSEDTIDAQRVPFNLRSEGREALADWFAERLSLSFFIQASGYTADTITYRGESIPLSTHYRGLNPVTAPSTNRKVFATGSADETVNASSSSKMSLELIDYAKEKAMTANPRVRPVMVNGKEMYVCYLHPYQVTDLRTNTSTGQWLDIQQAALAGGQATNNPIFTGALGVYNGVVLRESEDVVTGVHSSTGAEQTSTRRALFLGAQAVGFAQSSRYSKNTPYKWVEKLFQYDKELGISVQSLFGMKKIIYNGEDFGVLTISTYAAAHG